MKIRRLWTKEKEENRTTTVPVELREKFEDAYKSSYIRSKVGRILADYKKVTIKLLQKIKQKERPFYVDIYMETLGSTYNLLIIGGNLIKILVSFYGC